MRNCWLLISLLLLFGTFGCKVRPDRKMPSPASETLETKSLSDSSNVMHERDGRPKVGTDTSALKGMRQASDNLQLPNPHSNPNAVIHDHQPPNDAEYERIKQQKTAKKRRQN